MKKKKIISTMIAAALIFPAVIGLSGCRKKNDDGDSSGITASARNAYALSAASSIAYLTEETGGSAVSYSATAKPETLTDGDVTGIYNCLSMFDGIVLSGGIDQSIKNNSSTDDLLKDYNFEMSISLPTGSGSSKICTMYFDEINSKTNKEFDDGKEEIEVDTTFAGVIVYGSEKFVVEGETEVETEGNETEFSIEFKTYKNSSDTGLVADRDNYVVVEQSFENDEVEYEYTFFKNGRKVQDIELEYEEKRSGVEIEFQLKDVTSGSLKETVFKIKKGTNSNTFVVEFYKNNQKDTIIVSKAANNTYTFTYSNGFSETIPTV